MPAAVPVRAGGLGGMTRAVSSPEIDCLHY
jgi:hypothetical protein